MKAKWLKPQVWVLPLLILGACGSENSEKPSEKPDLHFASLDVHRGDLVKAARDGDLERVQSLIAAGASVNESLAGSGGPITPLLAAIAMGHADVAQYLVLRGADTQTTYQGYTPREFYIHRGLDEKSNRSFPWMAEEGAQK